MEGTKVEMIYTAQHQELQRENRVVVLRGSCSSHTKIYIISDACTANYSRNTAEIFFFRIKFVNKGMNKCLGLVLAVKRKPLYLGLAEVLVGLAACQVYAFIRETLEFTLCDNSVM